LSYTRMHLERFNAISAVLCQPQSRPSDNYVTDGFSW